jgi:tetratricopeptide (TPR) repeat protein
LQRPYSLTVSTEPPIDPAEFVATVRPLLDGRDVKTLTGLVRRRFSDGQITTLFRSDHADARKVAALAFGFVGSTCCLHKLAPLLNDPDPVVVEMAEHAMWSVWFRSGATPDANHELARGAQALGRRDFDAARAHFDRAIELDPNFAEAYNQRALVAYMTEQYGACLADCERVVAQMPCHFGAWAGMGHSHAHEGRFREALNAYERALAIHPRLECIGQAVQELRSRLNDA